MTRLEIYGIALLVLILALFGSYEKGRMVERAAIQKTQEAANAKALQDELLAAQQRTAADNAARDAANQFITHVNGELDALQHKYGSLPNIVVDAHGCPGLSPNFGLRWDAAASMSAGSTDNAAISGTHGAMPDKGMPTPR